MKLKIQEDNYKIAYEISLKIPEFQPVYYPLEIWKQRLENRKFLSLIAFDNEKPVGFKVGYFESETVFYSWMGGILPEYRKKGIGKKLAEVQEQLLRNEKVNLLTMKTRNRNQAMLIMAIKNNFKITAVEPKNEEILDTRIYLQKVLNDLDN